MKKELIPYRDGDHVCSRTCLESTAAFSKEAFDKNPCRITLKGPTVEELRDAYDWAFLNEKKIHESLAPFSSVYAQIFLCGVIYARGGYLHFPSVEEMTNDFTPPKKEEAP